jgi:molybdopterin-guanine dinucleotide biosynthesis protein B
MRVFGIAGWSGSGKTTLLVRLIPEIVGRGLSVSTIKHAHHGFDLDTPGKDSHEHRAAGATEVLISSARRFAVMHELRGTAEWSLHDLLGRMAKVDIVLVEGFKQECHAKLEVFRESVGKPPLHAADDSILAIASDGPCSKAGARPVLPLEAVGAIADTVLRLAEPLDVARRRLRENRRGA